MSAGSPDNERIVGKYRLGKALGEGGQGRVYRASPIAEGEQDVAIKLYELPTEQKAQDQARKRHQREVKALRSISAPSIVGVVDQGELLQPTIAHAGWLWIAFEFIEGRHLKHMMGLSVPPPVKAVSMLGILASGLDAVHATRTIHRDIKPENVILRGRKWDDPVLVDFGYARDVAASRMTRTGLAVGTKGYIAPEVERDATRASVTSDQWSFARLACEVLMWTCGLDTDEIPSGEAGIDEILERWDGHPATVGVLSQALDADPHSRDIESAVVFVNLLEEALYDDGVLEREAEPMAFNGQQWDKRRPLASYLKDLGFAIDDRRSRGGALWVIADSAFSDVSEYLNGKGVSFYRGKGRASGQRPAWWTKYHG